MWTAGGLALVAALHAPTAAPEPWYEQLATPVGPVCVAREDGAGAEWHEARAAWDAALRDLFPRDPLPPDKGSALALAGLDRVLMLTFCDATRAADPAPVERGVSDFLAHVPRDPRAPEAIFVRGVARLRAGQIEAGLADLAQVSRDAPTTPVAPELLEEMDPSGLGTPPATAPGSPSQPAPTVPTPTAATPADTNWCRFSTVIPPVGTSGISGSGARTA